MEHIHLSCQNCGKTDHTVQLRESPFQDKSLPRCAACQYDLELVAERELSMA